MYLFIFEREQEREWAGWAEADRKADSLISKQPDVGLHPRTSGP